MSDVEVFDSRAKTWRPAPAMPTPRDALGVAVLKDGRILAVGGYAAVDGHGNAVATTEIFDPRSGVWSPAADRPRAAWWPFTYRLSDGRVLTAGGSDNGPNLSAYIYDPRADAWSSAAPLRHPHEDGQILDMGAAGILIAGGYGNGPNSFQREAERYDENLGAWVPAGVLHDPRQAAALTAVGDEAALIGGTRSGQFFSSIELYNPRENQWRPGPRLKQPRENAAAIALDATHILVVGGDANTGPLDAAEIVDIAGPAQDLAPDSDTSPLGNIPGAAPDTLAVQNISGVPVPDPLPFPIWAPASVAVGGRFYVFGGQDANRWLNEALELDPSTGHWTSLPPLRRARFAPAAAVYGTSIIVAGGSVFTDRGVTSNDSEIFDYAARIWRAGPPMTVARASHSLAAVGRRVFAFGGVGDDGRGKDSVEVIERGAWKEIGDAPFPRVNAGTVVIDGRVYTVGGSDFTAGVVRRSRDFRVYDPQTGRWESLPPMPTAREGVGAAVIDGKIYVIGGDGDDERSLSLVEVYDLKQRTWSTAPPMLARRRDPAVGAVHGLIYVAGGYVENRQILNSVEVFDPRTQTWYSKQLTTRTSLPPPATPPVAVAPRPPEPAPMFFAVKAAERPHDYAIIVGVGRYERLPPADFAEDDARDAAAMVTALGVPAENVVTLSGPRASMTEVVKYVEEWLPSRVSADSRVYFYYSGHGAPNVLDGVPYLMPWDADASFVKSTGLPLERVYAALGKLPAKEVIAMIDACFSGAGGRSVLAPGTRPLVAVRAVGQVPPNISILTASASDEIAGSSPLLRHGLFSYYVMRGLSGEADPKGTGHVTLRQLHAYVRKHVILDARAEDREQTPTLTTPNPGLRLY